MPKAFFFLLASFSLTHPGIVSPTVMVQVLLLLKAAQLLSRTFLSVNKLTILPVLAPPFYDVGWDDSPNSPGA